MKLLKPKGKPQTKTVSFRVPPELAGKLEKLKADANAQGFILDLSEALTDALARHLAAVERELSTIGEAVQ